MHLDEIMELDGKYYMNTFGSRTPVCFQYGKGINLWDTEGRKYTDFYAGVAVSALGHSHPKLVNAIKEQAERFLHCANLYYIEPQAKLAKLLVESSCADRVFFANSGAEANEGAIKLARMFFSKKGMPHKYEIITMKKSFHGRTLNTLAATGQEKFHAHLKPLPPGFKYAPLNDIDALKAAITDSTCAVMLEPIQGEGGVNPADIEFMKGVRKLCDEKELLLILDEIQTGIGRTGKLFAYEHFGIEPDIFTLAKALGGGVPIGALCAKEFVASAFEPGDHGSTFGGNPLACAAGLAVMDVVFGDRLAENAAAVGSHLIQKLSALKQKYSFIKEIRGKGLIVGIEFSLEIASDVKNKCFERGYLIGSIGSNILRLLPPLIVATEDIDSFISTFDSILSKII
ncbi:MAG: aspartate aminotransferase family protein [Clostridia bacterium]|nr:aspartate aminotransferase family protein [Clostridia bacterium]